MSLSQLIAGVHHALNWAQTSQFPKNQVVRELRASESIVHKGANLKNAHRSDNKLCDLLAGLIVTKGYKNVLEIGTLFGFSTLHLAEAVEVTGGRVTTIDLRVGSRTWITGETVENIHEYALNAAVSSGLDKHIEFISGRSDVEMPKMTLAGRTFDLVFIDGSHSKYVVALDLINALNLLSPAGTVVLDDVSENVALRDYNHGGPNEVLMHLLGSAECHMLPVTYNTMLIRRRR